MDANGDATGILDERIADENVYREKVKPANAE